MDRDDGSCEALFVRAILILATIAAIGGVPCSAYVFGTLAPPDRKTFEELRADFEAELAFFTEAGLSDVEQGEVELPSDGWTHELVIEGGSCLAVVVASESAYPVRLALVRDETTLTQTRERFVPSLRWCSGLAERAEIRVFVGEEMRMEAVSAQDRTARFHFHMFAGRTDRYDAMSLPRGIPNTDALMAQWTRSRREAALSLEATDLPADALFPPVEVGWDDGAVLVPASDATRRMLRVGAVLGTTVPPDEFDAKWIDPLPHENPTSHGSADAIVRVGDGFHRVLAVLDPGNPPAMPNNDSEVDERRIRPSEARCTTMRFARLDDGDDRLVRIDLATWAVHEIPSRDGIALDQRCPGDPLTIYAVSDSVGASFRVRAFAHGSQARRQPAAVPLVPAHPRLAELEEACAENPEHCSELAIAHLGRYGVPNEEAARRAWTRGCASPSDSACIEFALFLRGADDAHSRRLLEDACEASVADACALLGDAYRLGEHASFDIARARTAYEGACDNGNQVGCDNLAAFELLRL